jgi:hypothetical protein
MPRGYDRLWFDPTLSALDEAIKMGIDPERQFGASLLPFRKEPAFLAILRKPEQALPIVPRILVDPAPLAPPALQ